MTTLFPANKTSTSLPFQERTSDPPVCELPVVQLRARKLRSWYDSLRRFKVRRRADCQAVHNLGSIKLVKKTARPRYNTHIH